MKYFITLLLYAVICIILPFGVQAKSEASSISDSVTVVVLNEYNRWLDDCGLSQYFGANKLVYTGSGSYTLMIEGATGYGCDQLNLAWQGMRNAYSKQTQGEELLPKRMMDVLSLLLETDLRMLSITIKCRDSETPFVKIYCEENGIVRYDESIVGKYGGGTISIPVIELKKMYRGNTCQCGFLKDDSEDRVKKVTRAIGYFLNNRWYRGKGTPFLHRVHIDTVSTMRNEFTFEYTHLSNEVIERYYEYHRIHVKVQDKGDGMVDITWKFSGKWSSGILLPARRQDYKLMEIDYKEALELYEEKLFKEIENYLRSNM